MPTVTSARRVILARAAGVVRGRPSASGYTATMIGTCLSFRARAATAFWSTAHSQAVMASRMFSTASFSSFPWETQPGSAGHSATTQPSSVGSRVT
jgi:hypothetical protein